MSLVRPVLEYGASCWGAYREGQRNSLGHVQKKEDKFENHKNDSIWETLVQLRKIALFASCSKHTPENEHGNL